MVKYYLRLSLFVKFVDVFGPTACRGLPERRPANTHASLGKSPARAGDLHVLMGGARSNESFQLFSFRSEFQMRQPRWEMPYRQVDGDKAAGVPERALCPV